MPAVPPAREELRVPPSQRATRPPAQPRALKPRTSRHTQTFIYHHDYCRQEQAHAQTPTEKGTMRVLCASVCSHRMLTIALSMNVILQPLAETSVPSSLKALAMSHLNGDCAADSSNGFTTCPSKLRFRRPSENIVALFFATPLVTLSRTAVVELRFRRRTSPRVETTSEPHPRKYLSILIRRM